MLPPQMSFIEPQPCANSGFSHIAFVPTLMVCLSPVYCILLVCVDAINFSFVAQESIKTMQIATILKTHNTTGGEPRNIWTTTS